jgi:putative DNA primase/helicase
MAKLDFDGLKSRLHANIHGHVSAWLPGGRKEGPEYVVVNPTRGDMKRGSFKINLKSGRWSDFAAGGDAKGGDLISLYAYLKGTDQGTAFKELNGPWDAGGTVDAKVRHQETKAPQIPDETFTPLPLPADAPAMPEPKGKPERVHLFHDEDGRVILREVVYRNKAGVKYPTPTSWGHHVYPVMGKDSTGEEVWTGKTEEVTGWCKKNWPAHRPPYNLHHLKARPEAVVYIAEGAKKADRLVAVVGAEAVTMAWIGGANGVAKTDWSKIAGRKVVIWPDYDAPGHKAALEIAGILRGQGCQVDLVWEELDAKLHSEGWDVVDETDDTRVRAMLDGAIGLDVVEKLKAEVEKVEGKKQKATRGQHGSMAAQSLANQDDLRCLGYGGDNKVYFMTRRRGVMVALAPEQMGNLSHLLTLMPLEFWYDLFPDKKGGVDKHACADALQRWAENTGYFDGKRVRGRGVWMEKNGDVVFHCGQGLMIGNKVVPIHAYPSEYVYEVKPDMGVRPVTPLKTSEAVKLIDACAFLNWEIPVYARLLAGWCMVAPVCGGLEWRPHMWLTGESGSGKTTALKEIVQRVCDRVCGMFIGGSSAPGIRQALSGDAIPVILDELEGETQTQRDELQKILGLARISSSEAGAKLVKGGQGGDAVEFSMRSCFFFMGIQVNVLQPADKNRITVLNLKGMSPDRTPDKVLADEVAFAAYQERLAGLLTDDYVKALHTRAYALLPIIRANAGMFKRAIVLKTKNSRTGDQLGTLAAGCYALESTKAVTLDEAVAWVSAQHWESIVSFDEMKDHDRCLTYILRARVRLQGDKGAIERSLGELVEKVASPTAIDAPEEVRVLRSYGLKVDLKERMLVVANQHTELERIMKATPYQTWNTLLSRIAGVKPTGTENFGAGSYSRAMAIPLDVVLRPGLRSLLPVLAEAVERERDLNIPF